MRGRAVMQDIKTPVARAKPSLTGDSPMAEKYVVSGFENQGREHLLLKAHWEIEYVDQ